MFTELEYQNTSNFRTTLDVHENGGHLQTGESDVGLLWEMSAVMSGVRQMHLTKLLLGK